MLLTGDDRKDAIKTITDCHYAHKVPSGKSYYFKYRSAIVVYSIPANKNIAKFILGYNGKVWELSRLWAPDKHERNLLSRAISVSLKELVKAEPGIEAIVSYADPNVGHHGGVYIASSWVYHGRTEDGRYYVKDGQVVSRRSFHSGKKSLTKDQILALGYQELKKPGKYRYVKPVTRKVRKSMIPHLKD
jgi:hypothetical protein